MDATVGTAAVAARYPEPHIAAAVAAAQHFTPGMAHSMALRDLHARGIRPPAWASRLGDVTATGAWRYRDGFGEREAFLLSFTYNPPAGDGSPTDGGPEQAEHAVLAELDTLFDQAYADPEMAAEEPVADWLAALTSVSDQCGDAEPPELADEARDYLAQGFDEMLLGDLTELAVEHAADRAQSLLAARERLTVDDER